MPKQPVRVAIVNDYEIVVLGIAAALDPYSDRVKVVELDSRVEPITDADVVLYDSYGQVQGDSIDVDHLLGTRRGKVVIFSWNTEPELVRRSLAKGVSGYLSKGLTGEELAEALERVHAGETVHPGADGDQFGRWPGDEHGLSARESEVLAYICQGMSNEEIAQRAYLGINTVKTYIRTCYRKIGVSTRAQAVIWGLGHGFEPDKVRHVVDRLDEVERTTPS